VTLRGLLGDATSSMGDAESSVGDAKSSVGDARSSLGDAKSSLGDGKSSLGDAKEMAGWHLLLQHGEVCGQHERERRLHGLELLAARQRRRRGGAQPLQHLVAMQKLRIETLRFGTARQKTALER
jgi:hypothetical protein